MTILLYIDLHVIHDVLGLAEHLRFRRLIFSFSGTRLQVGSDGADLVAGDSASDHQGEAAILTRAELSEPHTGSDSPAGHQVATGNRLHQPEADLPPMKSLSLNDLSDSDDEGIQITNRNVD